MLLRIGCFESCSKESGGCFEEFCFDEEYTVVELRFLPFLFPASGKLGNFERSSSESSPRVEDDEE